MTDRVVSYRLDADLIGELVGFVKREYLDNGKPIDSMVFVFEGKRPALFFKQRLSEVIGESFLPPVFLTVDELVEKINSNTSPANMVSDLESAFLVYDSIKRNAPGLLEKRRSFSAFLPWARDILNFIDQLDLEAVPPGGLKDIEANARIGYDIPGQINELLGHITLVRDDYHRALKERGMASRGSMYLFAARSGRGESLKEFGRIHFCNVLCHYKTEKAIVKDIFDGHDSVLFFQGDSREWGILNDLERFFGHPISPGTDRRTGVIDIRAGFDVQSEACVVREILAEEKGRHSTVIVMPSPENVVPLLTEISARTKDLNVSMGYPLKRSTFYSLISGIFRCQETKKDGLYYTKDILKVISHPFVKNLDLLGDTASLRIMIHKIEETCVGLEKADYTGSIFIDPDTIADSARFGEYIDKAMKDAGERVTREKACEVLRELNNMLFYSWEKIDTFRALAERLEEFVGALVERSVLTDYPLDLNIVQRVFNIIDEFRNPVFAEEKFQPMEVFRIFLNKLETEKVAFKGSPLKGVQVLGFLESRSLNFETVIVMDMNEGVMPRIRMNEPLIPREVMLALGLSQIEKEEEIQRYHFMRLIAHAKRSYLVYEDNGVKEKSRFAEEILWERQKASGKLGGTMVTNWRFPVRTKPLIRRPIEKTQGVAEYLKKKMYSATAINDYIKCPAHFYYKYVLGLREKEDLLSGAEARTIGNFMHGLLEEAFTPFVGKKPAMDKNFEKGLMELFDSQFDKVLRPGMGEDAFLTRDIMEYRLRQFTASERARMEDVESILCLERKFTGHIEYGTGRFVVEARIDRIDRMKDGSLLVIDYKTGGEDISPRLEKELSNEDISRESVGRTIRSIQLPLYSYIVGKDPDYGKGGPFINAALYNLRTAEVKSLFTPRNRENYPAICEYLEKIMGFMLSEIVDAGTGFASDDSDETYCGYCPYFYACGGRS